MQRQPAAAAAAARKAHNTMHKLLSDNIYSSGLKTDEMLSSCSRRPIFNYFRGYLSTSYVATYYELAQRHPEVCRFIWVCVGFRSSAVFSLYSLELSHRSSFLSATASDHTCCTAHWLLTLQPQQPPLITHAGAAADRDAEGGGQVLQRHRQGV